jgi:hypothetical protein
MPPRRCGSAVTGSGPRAAPARGAAGSPFADPHVQRVVLDLILAAEGVRLPKSAALGVATSTLPLPAARGPRAPRTGARLALLLPLLRRAAACVCGGGGGADGKAIAIRSRSLRGARGRVCILQGKTAGDRELEERFEGAPRGARLAEGGQSGRRAARAGASPPRGAPRRAAPHVAAARGRVGGAGVSRGRCRRTPQAPHLPAAAVREHAPGRRPSRGSTRTAPCGCIKVGSAHSASGARRADSTRLGRAPAHAPVGLLSHRGARCSGRGAARTAQEQSDVNAEGRRRRLQVSRGQRPVPKLYPCGQQGSGDKAQAVPGPRRGREPPLREVLGRVEL